MRFAVSDVKSVLRDLAFEKVPDGCRLGLFMSWRGD